MKNILIIGGSSGIGGTLAQNLTSSNKVFATYRNHPIGYERIVSQPYTVGEPFPTDWLPEELHGFVYCPGAIQLKPFQRIPAENFMSDFQFQVVGAIQCLQAVLPKLKAGSKASVVFLSTVAVQTGFPFHSLVSASKGAIEGLTRALAAELAPSIRVNAVAPSITDTGLASALLNSEDKIEQNARRHPLRRIGKTEDIAQALAFLLSDAADWVSGQVLAVDGGMQSLRV